MFRSFHPKYLSAQTLTSYVNRAQEKLSRRRRSLKKASTVNKRLASANLRSWWVGAARSVGRTKLHVNHNNGDAARSVLPSDWENRSTWRRRDRVSAGNSLEQFAFCRSQREKLSNTCTSITPFMNEYRVLRQKFIHT
ncbi:hypothetical protein AMECASPLE_037711 [Ameca splendens]|uniref:Uncharacterized protein n=1 Tax=Ameca splendens TaxID=208324 RepID=A0ABV1A3D9_9TELE